jgi:nitrate reductase NapE component
VVFDERTDQLGAVATIQEVLGLLDLRLVLQPVTALPLVDGFGFVVLFVVTGDEVCE